MNTIDLVQRLALALAIGLLIGIERGWQEREARDGARAAGIRTHALIGLLGGVWGLLSQDAGPILLGFGALAFTTSFAFFEWQEVHAAGHVSATGLVAGLLSFALGAYACIGNMIVAGSAAIVATLILAERRALHSFLQKLKWTELRAALLLLAMTFVLLPILPDHTIDPWGALNPHQLWLMTILIAAVSYGGYIAVRLAGNREGVLYAGAAGGLISSTTVTWTFAKIAKQQIGATVALTAGTTVAWTVSLLRMTAIAIVIAPGLALPLGVPIAAAACALMIVTWFFYRRNSTGTAQPDLAFEDPFDLLAVLRFGALLAAVMLIAKFAAHMFGQAGLAALAGISGLLDVDPITLSTAQMSGHSLDYVYGAMVILLAGASNLVAKCVVALVFGNIRFAAPLLAIALVAGSAGAITFLVFR